MCNGYTMTFGDRLKKLRNELGLSQEALGAQGFVSTPGWIKVENGQRQASERLIEKLIRWLVEQRYMGAPAAKQLREELFILKYLGSTSKFVREMTRLQAHSLLGEASAVLMFEEPEQHKAKPKRGRPVGKLKSQT